MEMQQNTVALPLRAHTILGVCEAVGEDFGFNPVLLRVPFAAAVLWSPTITLATYFLLGAVVLGIALAVPAGQGGNFSPGRAVNQRGKRAIRAGGRRVSDRLIIAAGFGARFE